MGGNGCWWASEVTLCWLLVHITTCKPWDSGLAHPSSSMPLCPPHPQPYHFRASSIHQHEAAPLSTWASPQPPLCVHLLSPIQCLRQPWVLGGMPGHHWNMASTMQQFFWDLCLLLDSKGQFLLSCGLVSPVSLLQRASIGLGSFSFSVPPVGDNVTIIPCSLGYSAVGELWFPWGASGLGLRGSQMHVRQMFTTTGGRRYSLLLTVPCLGTKSLCCLSKVTCWCKTKVTPRKV